MLETHFFAQKLTIVSFVLVKCFHFQKLCNPAVKCSVVWSLVREIHNDKSNTEMSSAIISPFFNQRLGSWLVAQSTSTSHTLNPICYNLQIMLFFKLGCLALTCALLFKYSPSSSTSFLSLEDFCCNYCINEKKFELIEPSTSACGISHFY